MKKCTILAAAVLAAAVSPALAQLRVATYNVSGNRAGLDTIFPAIGQEEVNGISKPLDVLLLQEQDTSSIAGILNRLNSIYGTALDPAPYARADLVGTTTGGGLPGLIYRQSAVSLIGAPVALCNFNTTANARSTIRYTLRPVGYDSAADLYVYNSHYKASDTSTDRNRRSAEATINRNNAAALPDGTYYLMGGDLNVYDGFEPAFQTLTNAGAGQVVDPLGLANTNWGTSAFRYTHTQSPTTNSFYGGQITGGMDDRFDFQLPSPNLNDQEGLSLIPDSYRAFGNNGTHQFNGDITTGNWAPAGVSNPAAVRQALQQTADHLPVVAEYQLPAVMEVDIAAVPATVIAGASVGVGVDVANVAPVQFAIGADELDFLVSTTGDLTGGGSGTDAALGGPQSVLLGIDTSTPGLKSGQVVVTSDSQAVQNGSFNQNVSVNVLDESNPSFATDADVNERTIDFGTVLQNTAVDPVSLLIANLDDSPFADAGLDLDNIAGVGDTDVLDISLASLFAGLAEGADVGFEALFDTSTLGIFSAQYLFSFSDEDLPGAQARGPLTLNLLGTVAIPEPTSLALLSVGAVGLLRRRR